MRIFLNDKVVDESAAVVSVFDHGFLYGDGVYETMRAYDGAVFLLDRHIERLGRSAALIRLRVPDAATIRNAVQETMSANRLKSAYIRITVSRGKGPIGLDPALCPEPTFVVIAEEFRDYPAEFYTSGVALIIARTRRNSVAALDPKIKSLNFLNNILAKIEAKEGGAYEALMLNADGFLAEGTVCNIFFVRGGVLCTPDKAAGVLDGITRELVLESAREQGIPVNEGMFTPADLRGASEVFITNTTSEVMPVARVDDLSFPVGTTTAALRQLYRQKVCQIIGRAGAGGA